MACIYGLHDITKVEVSLEINCKSIRWGVFSFYRTHESPLIFFNGFVQ